MLDVQFLVKSFMRPQVTRMCLESIRLHHAQPILLADDSPTRFDRSLLCGLPNITLSRLEPHTGLSAGRNHLLSQVTSKYFVLLDNDHMLIDPYTVNRLKVAMQFADADIACGLLWDVGCQHPRRFFGHFTREGQDIALNHYDPDRIVYNHDGGTKWCGCRYGSNFFLGKTDTFLTRNICWDPELKLMEHEDFFLRLPADVRVITVPDTYVDHHCCYQNSPDQTYARHRYDPSHRAKVRAKYNLASEFFLEHHDVVYDWTTWKFPQVI